MKRKEPQFFTIRNAAGQFAGTYRAIDEKSALAAFARDQIQTASTFRRSFRPVSIEGMTARVEPNA